MKHLLYSSALAAAEYGITKDKEMAVASLLAGVLVDVDHIMEYKDYIGHRRWNWKEFGSGVYFNKKNSVKVVFHSWEVAILLWWITLRKVSNMEQRFQSVVMGISTGYTLHLALDFWGNNLNKWGYFWLYRYVKCWEQDMLLNKKEKKNENFDCDTDI